MEIIYVSICGFFVLSSLVKSIKDKIFHKKKENVLPLLANYLSISQIYKYGRLLIIGYSSLFIGLSLLYLSHVTTFSIIDKIAFISIIVYTAFFTLLILIMLSFRKQFILQLLIEADKIDEETIKEEYFQGNYTNEKLYQMGVIIGMSLAENEASKNNMELKDKHETTLQLFNLYHLIPNLTYEDGIKLGKECKYTKESSNKMISNILTGLLFIFHIILFFSCMILLYHLLFQNIQF